jgi:phage tail-like protein
MSSHEDFEVTAFFGLSLDGVEGQSLWKEVSGLDHSHETIDERFCTPDGKQWIRKVPGKLNFSNIVLKRGLDTDKAIWEWRNSVVEQTLKDVVKNGTITMYSHKGDTIAAWSFANGWPIKYSGASFDAAASSIAMETIEIAHEGIKREQ